MICYNGKTVWEIFSGRFFIFNRRNYMSKSINISLKEGMKIYKRLKKITSNSEKAVSRSISDAATRTPAQVKKGIHSIYNVDAKAIDSAGPKVMRSASPSKQGKLIDGITLLYKGRRLTPVHFGMTPKTQKKSYRKKPSRIPGQAINLDDGGKSNVATIRQPRKYTVSMAVFKGQKIKFRTNTFVASAGKNNKGDGASSEIPFQRTGSGRGPTHAIHTLSVPQMIDNKDVNKEIEEKINNIMEKRVNSHIKQALKV